MNAESPTEGDWRAFARERMGRAEETLQVARLVLGEGFGHAVVNRLYYACFYAVEALLASEQRSARTHKGARMLFNKHFVKTGRFPDEQARFYNTLFEKRVESDYEAFVSVDLGDARSWLPRAETFVETVAALIDAGAPDS